MKYVKLGNSGVDVSRICLGIMSFGKPGSENGVFPWAMVFEDAKPLFKKAVQLGINFFDTANVYQLGSSEEITGKLIREFGLNRDEIVVATKVNFEMRAGRPNGAGSSRKNIMTEKTPINATKYCIQNGFAISLLLTITPRLLTKSTANSTSSETDSK